MSRRVELEVHVLRRRDFPTSEGQASAAPNIVWLQSQLSEYVERHSAEALFDSLVGSSYPWERSRDVVERVLQLIEAGWIGVESRPTFSSWAGEAINVAEEAVELSKLLPPEESSPVDPTPTPVACDPVSAAQVSTLLAAAKAGTPFCEVCVVAGA